MDNNLSITEVPGMMMLLKTIPSLSGTLRKPHKPSHLHSFA